MSKIRSSQIEKVARVLIVLIILVFLCFVLSFGFIILTVFGQKTMVNETVTLPPGGCTTYYLPPGMVYISIATEKPLDATLNSLTMHGYGQVSGGGGSCEGIGSPFITNYTIANPGGYSTNVSMQITTGVLNPFGYIWISQ